MTDVQSNDSRNFMPARIPAKDDWDNLTIANRFMFAKVMSDPANALPFLREVLPELQIDHIEVIQAEAAKEYLPGSKSVRFDIYIKHSDGRTFDVEMQAADTREIPRRSRYYSSHMDMDMLLAGEPYYNLKNSYVIFICNFDLFGLGYHKYVFRNTCEQNKDLSLDDGRTIIFLNTHGTKHDVSRNLELFLHYVAGRISKFEGGDFVAQIDKAVDMAKMDFGSRMAYMNWIVEEQAAMERGRTTGLQEGRAAGLQEGHAAGLKEGRDEILAAIQKRYPDLVAMHPELVDKSSYDDHLKD